jgi:hypothetical protein
MTAKTTFLGFVLAAFIGSLWHFAQQQPLAAKPKKDLYRTIQGRYEQEFLMTRDPATNTVPRDRLLKAYRAAEQKRAQMAQAERAVPVYWQERGPDNVGGRTRGLIFDANDPTGRTVWSAGVSGGLWRTANIDAASPTWTKVDDYFETMNITTLAQDPSNPNRMYFGTGEQGFAFGIEMGFGIWRSVDGGANWAVLPATFGANNFRNVNKIVVDAGGVIYVGTTAGVFRSVDGGNSFQQTLANNGNAQDVEIAANGDVYASLQFVGVFRFRNNMWQQLNSPNFPTNFRRIELACAPGDANVVYAAFESGVAVTEGTCAAVCRTDDGGQMWQQTASTPNVGDICWYCFIVAVDPNNTDRVWLGAQSLVQTTDGGGNWNGVGGVHPDHHAIVYRAGNSNEMVFGNDGGVYRCTNGANAGPSLVPKNKTYNVTQFYANALHPNAGSNYILGGTQDNGTRRFNAPGLNDTDEPTWNDGAFCFIDQDNPNIQVTGSQKQKFFVSNDGGASFSDITPFKDGTIFVTPACYDSNQDILYSSDRVDTLRRISDIGGANTSTFERIAALNGQQISALTVSPNVGNRIYMGGNGGRLLRIDNANQAGMVTVTTLNSPIANYLSCIAVEDGNENHLIITQSNYGTNSVWESTNGGTTWTDIDDDLPDMPVRWAMFHPFDPDKVLLATELGVWSTDDLDGTNTRWWPTNDFGLANVRVDMLQYRASDHLVAAATHGRGMFTTDYFTLLNTCVPSLNLAGAIAPGLYMAEDFIVSNGTIAPARKVIYHAGNEIKLTPGFHAQRGSTFWGLIEACGLEPLMQDKTSGKAGNLLASPPPDRSEQFFRADPLSLQCSPNPVAFNMSVRFELPESGTFSLYVRDVHGQMVQQVFANEKWDAGEYQVNVDAATFPAGIYLLTLQTQRGATTKQLVVAR